MATHQAVDRKERKALEYVLHDFLDLKASLDPRRTRPLKEFLFSKEQDGDAISAVDGFLLGQQLVLIQPGDPHSLEHLVFLCPADGGIRVKRLK
jgi:hypothetical protein